MGFHRCRYGERRELKGIDLRVCAGLPGHERGAFPGFCRQRGSPVYELDEEDFAIDREGERCISTRNIRDTDILDERTILFRMRGGDYFVNYLRNDCPGLVREERFSYRSSGGRLCQVDMIRVLEQFGGFIQEGMSCGLGVFYPISEEEAEFLALEPEERRGRPRIRVSNPDASGDGEEAGEAAGDTTSDDSAE